MLNYPNFKVDLSNCDKEPIHLIGRIQAHGLLMVIDRHSLQIEQVSANISDFIPDTSLQQWLGSSLLDYLPKKSRNWLEESFIQAGKGVINLAGIKFYGFCHFSDNKLVLECEPYSEPVQDEKLQELEKLSSIKSRLNLIEDPLEMAHLVAGEIREYLDYDRVNVIRFDRNWNSEVIGEALKGDADAFLGHRFPPSDIPQAARNLLIHKTIRQIPDVLGKAVEIVPYLNPSTGTPTNTLRSELRNPSEIHLEYLNNMEVRSTISFSIVVKGRLWGLITCHNYLPAFIEAWKRQVVFLMTQSLASGITSNQKAADLKMFKQLTHQRISLVGAIERHGNLAEGLAVEDLNQLLKDEAGGVAISLNHKIYTYGSTPSDDSIKALIDWLVYANNKQVFSTRCLWKVFPEAKEYKDVACGLFALEISRYNHEYLLFFKPEIPRIRIWAGKPEKSKMEGDYIHPRKSFEKWEETVRGKSNKWSKNEMDVAKTFVKDLTALQLRDQAATLKALNAELEKSSRRLAAKNSQLEDFNMIMAHNLRGPMNNILLLHEYYQEEPTEANSQFLLQKIPAIVENMITTMKDLNRLIDTRLEDELPSEEVVLEELVQREWENLQTEEMMSAGAELVSDLQVPLVYLPKAYAESILHNFISNALKYRAEDRNPQVEVKTWEEEEHIFLSVADNGLGMDLKAVGDKLFGLYKTFHFHKQAKGMGLYLTKMQVEALGGRISVESEPNKGTRFTVSFPKSHLMVSEKA